MSHTINFDCKTHHIKKDGTIPMLMRLSVNGEHVYINLGRCIPVKHYDKKNKAVLSGIKGYSNYTDFINRQKSRLATIIDESDKKCEAINCYRVKELYEQETGLIKSSNFCDFVDSYIKRERKLKNISSSTLDNYENHLAKLKSHKPKLTIHDITVPFLEEYKAHITDTLGLSDNSGYHAMCFIRKYTKKLFDTGRISKYPFNEFIVGKPFAFDPLYLEPEELQKLQELYDSQELLPIQKIAKSKFARDFNIGLKYQEVLRHYLAACYCGLRHSDIKTLKTNEIAGESIVKVMQKGRLKRKKTVHIPIHDRLRLLLSGDSINGLAFETKVMENSQVNKYLKAIAKVAGIKKNLSFHSSRHSFAINSLLLGIKIEVVSDVLGHSELSTTQRYARVIDRLRKSEMKKWDSMDQILQPQARIIRKTSSHQELTSQKVTKNDATGKKLNDSRQKRLSKASPVLFSKQKNNN